MASTVYRICALLRRWSVQLERIRLKCEFPIALSAITHVVKMKGIRYLRGDGPALGEIADPHFSRIRSTLVALRELRDMERRRIHEAEPAQAIAEKERREGEEARMRAEAERLARQEAERQAAQVREMAESLRLRRELDGARSEIAALRGQLDRANLAQAQYSAP